MHFCVKDHSFQKANFMFSSKSSTVLHRVEWVKFLLALCLVLKQYKVCTLYGNVKFSNLSTVSEPKISNISRCFLICFIIATTTHPSTHSIQSHIFWRINKSIDIEKANYKTYLQKCMQRLVLTLWNILLSFFYIVILNKFVGDKELLEDLTKPYLQKWSKWNYCSLSLGNHW